MKWIVMIALACLLVPAAWAQDDTKADKDSKDKKITIMDGKRFFPLRNARHFAGSSKPMPVNTNKQFMAPSQIHPNVIPGPAAIPKPAPQNTNTNTANPPDTHNAGGNSSPVLDIFTPQERGQ